jgi:hypothetical protein
MEKISNFNAKGLRGRCNYFGIKEKSIPEMLEIKLKTLLIGNLDRKGVTRKRTEQRTRLECRK